MGDVLHIQNVRIADDPPAPKATFSYSSGGGGMEPGVPMKDYIDARDDAVESRLKQLLHSIPTKATVWGAVATGIGTLLAILAFGGDRFDGGVGASGLLRTQAERHAAIDSAQDSKLELIDQKLDILITQTSVRPTPSDR